MEAKDESNLEQQLKDLDRAAEALGTSKMLAVREEVHKIRATILGAIYMITEEWDPQYAIDSLSVIREKLHGVSKIAFSQSGEFAKADTIPAPPDVRRIDVVEFNNKMLQLVMRHSNVLDFMETMTYRTAIKMLKEAIGKEQAEIEIDNFFHTNRHLFMKKQ